MKENQLSNINDCIVDALHDTDISGVNGDINDLLLVYYQTNGATSDSITDAEYEFLLAQGVPAAQVNDMWFTFLSNQGYPGSLNDMKYRFWCVNSGVIPLVVPNIVGLTAAQADLDIVAAGLIVGVVTGTVDPVISQDPVADTLVIPGSAVDYTLTS